MYQGPNSKNLNKMSKKLPQTVNKYHCKALTMVNTSSALHAVTDKNHLSALESRNPHMVISSG